MKTISILAFIMAIASMGNCLGQRTETERVGTNEPVAVNSGKGETYLYYYLYKPGMKLYGDTLYVSHENGLYRKDLRNEESPFSLIAFEGIPVVDFARAGSRYLALAYGDTKVGDSLLFLSERENGKHEDISPDLFRDETKSWMYRMSVNPQNPSSSIVCRATDDCPRFFQTFDFGKTWRTISMAVGEKWPVIKYHPLDSTLIFQAGATCRWTVVAARIARSEDNGETWSVTESGAYTIFDIAFHPRNADILLYSDDVGGIGRSEDRGKTWNVSKLPYNDAVTKIVFDEANPETVYGITNTVLFYKEDYGISVYRSLDEGKTWEAFLSRKFPFEETGAVVDVLYYKNKLLFYTIKGGIHALNLETLEMDWIIPVVENGTVAVESGSFSPEIKIYPNPVREVLRFETTELVNRVVLTDMSGRVVKSKDVSGKEGEVSVNGLKTGIYVACFYTERGFVRKKIAVL